MQRDLLQLPAHKNQDKLPASTTVSVLEKPNAQEKSSGFFSRWFRSSHAPDVKNTHQVEHKMPDGPIFCSFNKIWNSFVREVVLQRPDVFKIGMINMLASLFPSNPFVAGFGMQQY